MVNSAVYGNLNVMTYIIKIFALMRSAVTQRCQCALLSITVMFIMGSIYAADPHIGYVYPAGGTPGSEFTAKIGGQFIFGAKSAYINDKNIQIQIINATEPENYKPNRQKMAISETITIKISIGKETLPGNREIAIVTDTGISNKLIFNIGQLQEVVEVEPNDKPSVAKQLAALPVTLNGQIFPGDVDSYKFSAKKGQLLVVEAYARALIPYLADAVPGWFKICLTLSDAAGRELAFADDYRFLQDSVLFFKVPADGVYFLAVRDSIYRGREDFVYRVNVGELPYITNIFPLGASTSNQPATVNIYGVNLPSDKMTIDTGRNAPDTLNISVSNRGLNSNRMPFAVDNLPEIFASSACESRDKKQQVKLPVIINGCIKTTGAKNYFCFEAHKGQVIAAKVAARKLNSPLDSAITLYDQKGTAIKENDDAKDIGEGFLTHQADSNFMAEIPNDGIYTIRISDTQNKGGADYAYRLTLGSPSPDFAVIISPAALFIPAGAAAAITVHAVRYDGFNGEIKIELKNKTQELSISGGVIPANINKTRMTLNCAAGTTAKYIVPELVATAIINGNKVTRTVSTAEDSMQAFIYRHLVASDETTVMVSNNTLFSITTAPIQQGYFDLVCGKDIGIVFEINRAAGFTDAVVLQLVDPPKGIKIKSAYIPPKRNRGMLYITADNEASAGINNLIISAVTFVESKNANKEMVLNENNNASVNAQKNEPKLLTDSEMKSVKMIEENKNNKKNEIKSNIENNKNDSGGVKVVEPVKPKRERVQYVVGAIPVKIIKP